MLGLRTSIPFFATAVLLVAPAEATTSYYQGSSGETAFTTAVGGLTLLDPGLTFSSGDLAPGGLYNASGTGIDFLGFDGGFPGFGPLDFTVNSGSLTATNGGEVVQIDLPASGLYAFGVHITVTSTSSFGNWCFELTLNACNATVTTANSSSIGFLGFTSTTPITGPIYLRPTGGSPIMVLTNFEAFADPVPEASTMLLVGLALVILPLARRKIRPGQ